MEETTEVPGFKEKLADITLDSLLLSKEQLETEAINLVTRIVDMDQYYRNKLAKEGFIEIATTHKFARAIESSLLEACQILNENSTNVTIEMAREGKKITFTFTLRTIPESK